MKNYIIKYFQNIFCARLLEQRDAETEGYRSDVMPGIDMNFSKFENI